jgi:hypothetical protein
LGNVSWDWTPASNGTESLWNEQNSTNSVPYSKSSPLGRCQHSMGRAGFTAGEW